MKHLKTCLALAAALCLASAVAPASADPVKNIVLVHGAWVDASGWKPVYEILTKEGFNVTMVQEPETSFADDVAATKRVLDLQDGPTLLVGHSYGGSIITEAGVHPKVVGLVYVAAHAPDVGEDEGALGKKTPSVLAKTEGAIKKTPDGFTYLDPAEFPKLFAPDLPRERAEFVARSQVLAAAKVFSTPLTAAAWKTKPSWGIVAGSDQIINPDLERWYYARAKSHTTEIKGASHSVYESHPRGGRGRDRRRCPQCGEAGAQGATIGQRGSDHEEDTASEGAQLQSGAIQHEGRHRAQLRSAGQAFERELGHLDPLVPKHLVEWKAPWSEVEREIGKAAGPHGLMIIARADQGSLISLAGREKRCSLYLVGNPVIASRIIDIDMRASFYVPFRVALYDDGGPEGAVIAFDRPSSFLAGSGSPRSRRSAGPWTARSMRSSPPFASLRGTEGLSPHRMNSMRRRADANIGVQATHGERDQAGTQAHQRE